MAVVIAGITAAAWSVSAERETRTRFPEKDRFFPSRWYIQKASHGGFTALTGDRWSKQIIEHEKALAAKNE